MNLYYSSGTRFISSARFWALVVVNDPFHTISSSSNNVSSHEIIDLGSQLCYYTWISFPSKLIECSTINHPPRIIRSTPFSMCPISQEIWEIWFSILKFIRGAKYFPKDVSSCPENPNLIGFSHSITKMLWIWALSWLRIKTFALMSRRAWMFLDPLTVSMVTVYNNLKNIWGWCIHRFFRNPFKLPSS
jgi:hypothetical protein